MSRWRRSTAVRRTWSIGGRKGKTRTRLASGRFSYATGIPAPGSAAPPPVRERLRGGWWRAGPGAGCAAGGRRVEVGRTGGRGLDGGFITDSFRKLVATAAAERAGRA